MLKETSRHERGHKRDVSKLKVELYEEKYVCESMLHGFRQTSLTLLLLTDLTFEKANNYIIVQAIIYCNFVKLFGIT